MNAIKEKRNRKLIPADFCISECDKSTFPGDIGPMTPGDDTAHHLGIHSWVYILVIKCVCVCVGGGGG